MSLNLNTVLLAGHLTRDPQLRSLPNDSTVASFGIAINRRFKGADGEVKEDSTFVECEAWNRTAELVGQYLAKGSACYLQGRLKLESWESKDGSKQQRLKVVVENVQFLGKPMAKGGEPSDTDAAPTGPAATLPPANLSVASSPIASTGRRARETVGAAKGSALNLADQPPF